MSKADEMFRELGYTCFVDERYISYENNGTVNKPPERITFEIIDKTIYANRCPGVKSITMSELAAINEKVKELGWV